MTAPSHVAAPMPAAAPDAIAVDALVVRFGARTAVDGVSLAVAPGEVVALLGHNGAGKTTTVRALNGILEPTAGRVRVLGLDPVRDGVALRRRTAVLTETPTLDDRLTARETLAVFAELYAVPAPDVRGRVASLLERFELAERADDRVGGFSKGMRQRLSLARALLHEPDVLYLDEPTAGLDPVATRALHTLIGEWSRARRRTVILCTHNLAEAEALCDRVAVLARGRLLAAGTVAELARRVAPAAGLTLEVDAGDVAAALRALADDAHPAPRAEGATIAVPGVAREQVPALVARLAAAGVRLYRVEPGEPSLEDVYFALTSGVGIGDSGLGRSAVERDQPTGSRSPESPLPNPHSR